MATANAVTANPATANAVTANGEFELSHAQFTRIARLLHAHAGIRMRPGKEGLVRARLAKRLRALALADFDGYLEQVESGRDRTEFAEMVDALTTNKTSFLREAAHFDYLREHVLDSLTGSVRLWSAGCATGEEPYTLAMLLADSYENLAARDVRILATDISARVLATAKAGMYSGDIASELPAEWLERYWTRRDDGARVSYGASPVLRRQVAFARLNLMESWPMRGPFDGIFCRNVMIYFDKPTQQRLVERFWALLRPGGHLFVGHSESLSGLTHRFRYVQPAVYVK